MKAHELQTIKEALALLNSKNMSLDQLKAELQSEDGNNPKPEDIKQVYDLACIKEIQRRQYAMSHYGPVAANRDKPL